MATGPDSQIQKSNLEESQSSTPQAVEGSRLSNFSIFLFDFTSYQFVTPPAVLRAFEIASEW